MGEAQQAQRLSDAAGRRAPGGLAARHDLKRFAQDASGATAIEYALLAAVLGLVIITAAGVLRAQIYALLISVSDALV
ncbi:MAG: Flp family type IVb pilin [Phenylobacterium sp.]|nr:Flp family type IVb pilin [Phenylobacterium sp.]MDP1617456.1 Flp family type IVb pilin [Phenylobacterium sp.]MDP1988793.1 Flp family type IVb pilin [Phenylobacterium sp.]